MAIRLGMAAAAVASLSCGMAAAMPYAPPTTAAPSAVESPEPSGRVADLALAFRNSLARPRNGPDQAAVELALLADIERSGLEPQECRMALAALAARPLTPAQRSAVQTLTTRIASLLQERPTDAFSLRGPVAPQPASVIVSGGPPPPSSPDTPDYRPGR